MEARTRSTALALALLLGWSLLVRIWLGSVGLDGRRFWDERYALENVGEIVGKGHFGLANAYHPSLAHLPYSAWLLASESLYRATGWEALRIIEEVPVVPQNVRPAGRHRWDYRVRFTPSAYLQIRGLQSLVGVVGLWFLFLLGRRIFSEGAGLLATVLLSGVYWHLRQSAIFKPDILLVLGCLAAFYYSYRAATDPSLRSYLLAGGVIGLALSTKFNAGPIAIPLVLATVVVGRHRRRVWLWLGAAGAASAAVFLILNPWVLTDTDLYIRNLGGTLDNYSLKGARAGSSRLSVLWHGLSSLLSTDLNGRFVGLVGLVGGVSLAFVGRPSRHRRLGVAMIYSFLVSYAILYAAMTTNLSPHNWLPLAPFVALLAAAAISQAWSFAQPRWPVLATPKAKGLVVSVLGLWLVGRSTLYSYPIVVPTTEQSLAETLARRLKPVAGRVVYYEDRGLWPEISRGRRQATTLGVEQMTELDESILDLADAEIFYSQTTSDQRQRFLASRSDRAEAEDRLALSPRPFVRRGNGVVAIVHPWRRKGDSTVLTSVRLERETRRSRLELAALNEPGSHLTLEIRPPRGLDVAAVRIGGQEIVFARVGGGRFFRTVRFKMPAVTKPLVLRFEANDERRGPHSTLLVTQQRWAAP